MTADLTALIRRLTPSGNLAAAQLCDVPLIGDGSPQLRPQARDDADQLSETGLADLISSIGTVGQLQPILTVADGGTLTVLVGERRLRAMRIGYQRQPDNPHWEAGTIRTLRIEGPLSPWELRAVQLAENLARKDLTDADLARALVYGRIGLLVERAMQAGLQPPDATSDDPLERWDQLVAWRDSLQARYQISAPWPDVIATLGVALSPSRAKELVMAVRRLPVRMAEELDAAEVSSRSRIGYARLIGSGRDDAAELLTAVQEAGGGALHETAVKLAAAEPELPAAEIVSQAVALRQVTPTSADGGGGVPTVRGDGVPSPPEPVDLSDLLTHLRDVATELRGGAATFHDRDLGSLLLLCTELAALCDSAMQRHHVA